MKRKLYISGLALAALMVVLLVGCDLLPVSISDRVDLFVADLNLSDRTDVYLNLAEGYTDDYNIHRGTEDIWDLHFTQGIVDISYSALDTSDSNNVVFRVVNDVFDKYVKLKMRKIGNKWFIEDLYTGGSSTGPWGLPIID